jgi:hypothetical protein
MRDTGYRNADAVLRRCALSVGDVVVFGGVSMVGGRWSVVRTPVVGGRWSVVGPDAS